MRIIIALLITLLSSTASAAPPKGADPAMAPWFDSLKQKNHAPCCGAADCRPESRVLSPGNSHDGHWWVFMSHENFGDDAPEKMVPVPDDVVRSGDTTLLRPETAVVCAHYLVILCFIPPQAAG